MSKNLSNSRMCYLHCARREWQPECWWEAAMQTLLPPQLRTTYQRRCNLKAQKRGLNREQQGQRQSKALWGQFYCTRDVPPCAGSCPDPPPDSRATLPLRLSKSERSTTLWPFSSDRPPEALTRPHRASSTQPSTELINFF